MPGADAATPSTPSTSVTAGSRPIDWSIGAAAALVLPAADGDRTPQGDVSWPTGGWPGVLTTGTAPRDQRGSLRLEHATLDAAAGLQPARGWRVDGQLAVGWHDREAAHVETAWLSTTRLASAARPAHWRLGAGRRNVPLGPVIGPAGHFDGFSAMPVAKQASFDGHWIDDGVLALWQRAVGGQAPAAAHDHGGPPVHDHARSDRQAASPASPQPHGWRLQQAEVGLWRGAAFPGSAHGPWVPTVHVAVAGGDWQVDLSAAHWSPQARGAAALSATTGASASHVHGSLDCREGLAQKVCFDGQVDLLAGSWRWRPSGTRWQGAVAVLLRHEDGTLYNTGGSGQWRSTGAGGWADAWYQAHPAWRVGLRLETQGARQTLAGTGTAALATAAGLDHAGDVHRATMAVVHQPLAGVPALQLAAEAGTESSGAGRTHHVAVRLLWQGLWSSGTAH